MKVNLCGGKKEDHVSSAKVYIYGKYHLSRGKKRCIEVQQISGCSFEVLGAGKED